MALSIQEQFDELSFYTLAHQSPAFIHQHIVDAHLAQNAHTKTKSISIVYSLVGLYLFIEKNYTGKTIQQIHTQMAKEKKLLPAINLPLKRGDITISNVLTEPPGRRRDEMIQNWCKSVWNAYKNSRMIIVNIAQQLIVE